MVYPLETNITWISGKDDMTSYVFGKERIAHSFCPTCGTVSPILSQPASFGHKLYVSLLPLPVQPTDGLQSIGGKSTDPNFFADNRAVNVCHDHRYQGHVVLDPVTTEGCVNAEHLLGPHPPKP